MQTRMVGGAAPHNPGSSSAKSLCTVYRECIPYQTVPPGCDAAAFAGALGAAAEVSLTQVAAASLLSPCGLPGQDSVEHRAVSVGTWYYQYSW